MRSIAFPQLEVAAWRHFQNSSVGIAWYSLCLPEQPPAGKSSQIVVAQLRWYVQVDLLGR